MAEALVYPRGFRALEQTIGGWIDEVFQLLVNRSSGLPCSQALAQLVDLGDLQNNVVSVCCHNCHASDDGLIC